MSTTYQDFLDALGQRESGGDYTIVNGIGYLGKYQFGELALIDLGYYKKDGSAKNDWKDDFWTGKNEINKKKEFLDSPTVQESAIQEYMQIQWRYLKNFLQYEGQKLDGTEITITGLLGGAHLVGHGETKKYLKSGGDYVPVDGNRTKITEYIKLFAGYESPFTVDHEVAEKINGGSQSDVLQGLGGDDTLDGKGGKDTLKGGSGNDTLIVDHNEDIIEELPGEGIDTVQVSGKKIDKINFDNVESITIMDARSEPIDIWLNQTTQFQFTDKSDDIVLHVNKILPDQIVVRTGQGADTIHLEPTGIDLSKVHNGVGITDSFDFIDFSANDILDVSAFRVRDIIKTNITMTDEKGFYLIAPGATITIDSENPRYSSYSNNTTDWYIAQLGSATPWGPQLHGNLTEGSFKF